MGSAIIDGTAMPLGNGRRFRAVHFLKFAPDLHQKLRHDKRATWRIGCDREIEVGDGLVLCGPGGLDEQLGHAYVTEVFHRTLDEMTLIDALGHEAYRDEQHLIETFEGYYGQPVGRSTAITVIRFHVFVHFHWRDGEITCVLMEEDEVTEYA
ncbi:MAG TPA: hypothetical protein VMS08_00185 [Candidatus Saccharimonadia bacterium]|nr:hypothetical protein [Candidatus Saccharimonadia bacterium]